jgi:amidase
MGYHPDVDAAAERAVKAMQEAGATVIDVQIPTWGQWDAPELILLLYEFKDGLNAYLKAVNATPGSLTALIEWNQTNAARAMPLFAQELFEQAEGKGPLTDSAYRKARDDARRLAGRDGLLAVLEKEHLDAVVAPSMSPAWLTDHVLGDHFVGAGYGVAAVAGTPSLTIPAGESHGLPLGITLMGRAWSEANLLGLGFALEQKLKARRAPTLLPTSSHVASAPSPAPGVRTPAPSR